MQPFNVGTAFGETIRVAFRNITAFGPAAVLYSAIFSAMLQVFGPQWIHFDFELGVAATSGYGTFSVFFILFFCLTTILIAVVTYGAYQDFLGQRVGFRRAVIGGIRLIPSAIVPGLAVGIAIGLLTVPMVIPGIIAFVYFFAVIPVATIERRGVWASLRRSFDLGRGNRWAVFWLFFFVNIVSTILFSVGGLVAPELGGIVGIVAELLLLGLGTMILAVTPAAAYFYLRQADEGVTLQASSENTGIAN